MSLSDGDHIDAGEYALGLEANPERRRFEAGLIDDPELSQAVWNWEERFRPLADALRPRPAPRRVWRAVASRLFGADERAMRKARRAIAFWRDAALVFMTVAGITAASLVVIVVRPDLVGLGGGPRAEDWIAAIVRLDGTIALARVDDEGRLVAEPVPTVGPDRSAELWLVPPSGVPVSLGLLDAVQRSHLALPPEAFDLMDASAEFVVTSEPAGGSPTGQPTGERLGSGSLTQI